MTMTMRLKLLLALAAIALLIGSAAIGLWLVRDGVVTRIDKDADRAAEDVDAVPADLVRQAQPIYYEIDPPLTVNLKDTDAILQVGISLSTHFASVNDALKNDDPALRSAILFALADVQADTATNDASKEQLLSTIVGVVNRQLRRDGYSGSVDSAYFTSFIIQNQDGGDV
jgi:flagellar basal body-associated protein FliL